MVINIMLLGIISYACYILCNKSFLVKEEFKNVERSTIIIFQISFILSNLVISFIILYAIFPINTFDMFLWKFFLTLFSLYFFYFLPFYLIYKTFDHSNKKGLNKIIYIYIFYLVSSNIIYRFFNFSYEKSIFKFGFYFSNSNILEYLAFIANLFNAISSAYNAVTNISSLLIYPILKKKKLLKNNDASIKKNLDDINSQIDSEEARLNELNIESNELKKESEKNNNNLTRRKSLKDSKKNVINKLNELKSIQISYEFQLNVKTKKENEIQDKSIITIIINLIKIIQGLAFLYSGAVRCFTLDYSYFSQPLDLNEKSIFYNLLKAPYFKFLHFSDGFISFLEQAYSLILVFMIFSTNFSVSKDRLMNCINYVFSFFKKNKKTNDVEIIFFSFFFFFFYLICGLLVVNSMKYIYFRDKLHKYLFPGFDFENLHWHYDGPYVLGAAFFIVKEIVEYSNIVSPKKD